MQNESASFYRQPDFYLIAFNDRSIQAAKSVTVDGDLSRWTPRDGGAEQTAPLSSVDRRFSEQITRDRHVDFRIQ